MRIECKKEEATSVTLLGGSEFGIRYIDNIAKLRYGTRESSFNKHDIWQIVEKFWKEFK